MSDRPRFGEWFVGIHASKDNPRQRGMYVRTVRRTGRVMNPGTFYELTDGRGDFWQCPVDSVARRSGSSLEDRIVYALIDEVARLRLIEEAARSVALRESRLTDHPLDLELRMGCAQLRTALDGEEGAAPAPVHREEGER